MQVPIQISFRNMDPSPSVEAVVREKAAKLERFFDRIVSCHVTIEAPHRHHHPVRSRPDGQRLDRDGTLDHGVAPNVDTIIDPDVIAEDCRGLDA